MPSTAVAPFAFNVQNEASWQSMVEKIIEKHVDCGDCFPASADKTQALLNIRAAAQHGYTDQWTPSTGLTLAFETHFGFFRNDFRGVNLKSNSITKRDGRV